MMVPVKFIKTHSPHIAGSIATVPDFEANQYLTKGIAQKVVVLKFLRHHSIFNPGEVAGFGESDAKKIIAKGLAVDVNAPKPEQVAEPVPSTEEITVEIEPGKKNKKRK